jgi:hypothetical protein
MEAQYSLFTLVCPGFGRVLESKWRNPSFPKGIEGFRRFCTTTFSFQEG